MKKDEDFSCAQVFLCDCVVMKENESIKLTDFTFTQYTEAFRCGDRLVPAKWAINYQNKMVGMIIDLYGDGNFIVYKFEGEQVWPLETHLPSRRAAVRWVQDNADEFIA